MPGQSESVGLIAETLGIVSLPQIAGMSPDTWVSILVIAFVFGLFLLGSPGRGRR